LEEERKPVERQEKGEQAALEPKRWWSLRLDGARGLQRISRCCTMS
jgi:hypothetical protein